MGPLVWNRIPKEIQEAGTIFTFKKQLKIHIFELYRGDPEDEEQNNANDNHSNTSNNNHRNNNNQRWRQNVDQPFVSRWNQSQS